MRYTGDLGCRYRGIPHQMEVIHDTPRAKHEKCLICGVHKRYNKGYRGRVKNTEYLKDHVRNFAQKNGVTKRIYKRIYQPEQTIIRI